MKLIWYGISLIILLALMIVVPIFITILGN